MISPQSQALWDVYSVALHFGGENWGSFWAKIQNRRPPFPYHEITKAAIECTIVESTRESHIFEFANVLNVPCLFLQKFSSKLHELVLKSVVETEHFNCCCNAYPLAKLHLG